MFHILFFQSAGIIYPSARDDINYIEKKAGVQHKKDAAVPLHGYCINVCKREV